MRKWTGGTRSWIRAADSIAWNVDMGQDDSRERRTVHVAVGGVPETNKNFQPTLNGLLPGGF